MPLKSAEQIALFEGVQRRRPRLLPSEVEWYVNATNAQGDFIFSTIQAMNLSDVARVDCEAIDKFLVKNRHDLTKRQIRVGAENALDRGLLDKEGRDRYFIYSPLKARQFKRKKKKVNS
jgi:hypothetical protein